MNYSKNHCLGADLPINAFMHCGDKRIRPQGGGGTSTPDSRYANLDALYGVQTQASQYMLDNALPHIPGVTNNSAGMVDEAMSGRLSTRLRDQASTDADAAMGSSTQAMNQNLERYGINPNSGAFAGMARKNAVEGAANKVGAMNSAGQFAEDQKWNRNANFYGQVMGMNNGAMQGMSSAGAGLGGVASQQGAAEQKNAAGFGTAGAAFGAAVTKADGGYIKAPKLASGGNAWEAYKKANPIKPMSSNGGQRGNGLMQMLGGAAPSLLGAGVKDLLKDDSKLIKMGRGLIDKFNQPAATGQAFYTDPLATSAETTAASAIPDPGINDVPGSALNAPEPAFNNVTLDASAASGEVGNEVGNEVAGAASDEAARIAAEEAARLAAEEAARLAAEAAASNSVSAMGNFFARGGMVKCGVRLAMGGMPRLSSMGGMNQASVARNDSSQSMRVSSMDDSAKPARAMPVRQSVAASAPTLGASDATRAISNAKEGYKAGSEAAAAVEKAANASNAAGSAATAADATAKAGEAAAAGASVADGADGASGASGAGSVVKGVVDIANGRDPATAVADAALGYGGAQAGATIGMAAGPVGAAAGAVIGGLLGGSFLADGGDVEREDFTPGGAVDGPGTTTSDDIPAWLSAGEHVQNAVSTELAGQDVLDDINEAGLDVRYGRKSPEEAKQAIGETMIQRGNALIKSSGFGVKTGVKLAGGGFLGGNLGIALGAGVDQYNRQQEVDQRQQAVDAQKLNADRSYELQKQASERQKTLTEQQAKEFAQKEKSWEKADQFERGFAAIANKEAEAKLTPEQMLTKVKDGMRSAASVNGVESAALTPDQEKFMVDNFKPDLKAVQQEYVDHWNRYTMPDKALAYQNEINRQEAGSAVESAATNPVIKAIAKLNPGEAAKLQVGETNFKERLEQGERAAALRSQNAMDLLERRIDAKMAGNGSGGSGGSGKTGSGKSGDGGMKDSDRIGYVEKVSAGGLSGKDAAGNAIMVAEPELIAQTQSVFDRVLRHNPNAGNYELAQASLDMVRRNNGLPTKGKVGFENRDGAMVPVINYDLGAAGRQSFAIGPPRAAADIAALRKQGVTKVDGVDLPNEQMLRDANKADLYRQLKSIEDDRALFAKGPVQRNGRVVTLEQYNAAARAKQDELMTALQRLSGDDSAKPIVEPLVAPSVQQTTTRAGKLVSDAVDSTWGTVRDWSEKNRYRGNDDTKKKTADSLNHWFKEPVQK